ncbi:MAG TPA: hypothetical protein VN969_39825 [Streptosporangiaceae bacterium]|nr:hypothetical protein [Streptosporangiaceae bacterium]
MKILTITAAVMLGIAGCGSIVKTSTPTHAAAATTASSTAAPSPANNLTGPVGTSYAVTDQSDDQISVALTRVIDPAQGADQFDTVQGGDRFVGAVFTIKGINGTFSDDANNDATLIGSNGQTYTADFDSIAGYTNFNDGEYSVSTGEISAGAVTFQVPVGVTVSKIEWSANGGLGGAPGEWLIPTQTSAAESPASSNNPWSVISAYFQDVSQRDYAAAWKLLGPALQVPDYASFVAGYADTGQQTVTETGQSGDQVSFTLRSDNPDGTVQTYQGTETVTGGKIVAAHVAQTS